MVDTTNTSLSEADKLIAARGYALIAAASYLDYDHSLSRDALDLAEKWTSWVKDGTRP